MKSYCFKAPLFSALIRTRFTTPRVSRALTTTLLLLVLLIQPTIPALACGPETIEPIFVFNSSPDLPFTEFTKGKIGVLQPTFGRKTLVIAYRYLNGRSFTEDEQSGLVAALKGKPPEEDDGKAVKAWIEARKLVVGEEHEQPAIYDERRHSGYDFFPNCTRNAFEVAIQTLKDRVSSYGAEDRNVREWLNGQDVVFRNCAEGAQAPQEVSAGSPRWLQKDRDYQVAAAFFYSLNFKEAKSRFAKIAEDSDSDWQETARYLVGRTLVREASLTKDEKAKLALYAQAEAELINIMARGGQFQNASKRLLGLVKYRLRPEERVRELAQTLADHSGNENVRQDLIDYTWLLDKFDARVRQEEEERKQKLNPQPTPTPFKPDPEYQARYDAIQRGELIEFYFSPRNAEGEAEYSQSRTLTFKFDVTETEVFQQLEIELGRKLSEDETKDVKERFASAQLRRQWLLSPNRQVDGGLDYDGCHGSCNETPLESFPAFLRSDELSDWILTFQSDDSKAYAHAYSKWRQTGSDAWLSLAFTKVNKSFRSVSRLIQAGEQVSDDSAAFPTVAYHLARLYVDLNRSPEAEKLLDKVIATQFENLSVSSQNLFLEQRMKLARTFEEFLKFSFRKPAAFYEAGTIGSIADMLKAQKEWWDPQHHKQTKEEFERETEQQFRHFLPWDERKAFDSDTADLFNWHFSIKSLVEASKNPNVPDYLRRSLVLSAWVRAILLKNEAVARETSPEVSRLVPEMSSALSTYLNASSRQQQEDEALYILLKFSNLTPYVAAGVPKFSTPEEDDYYFVFSWWCRPEETQYDENGNEISKRVPSPRFFNAATLATAKRERTALAAIGDAKSYLGKRVLDWAKRSPKDPRMPEALYIVIKANESYKYGCGSWEEDEETRTSLEKLLKERYANSPWTAKLAEQ